MTLGLPLFAFTFAHRTFWAAAILALPAADILPRFPFRFAYAAPKAESAAAIALTSLVKRSCSFFKILTTSFILVIKSPLAGIVTGGPGYEYNRDFVTGILSRRAQDLRYTPTHISGLRLYLELSEPHDTFSNRPRYLSPCCGGPVLFDASKCQDRPIRLDHVYDCQSARLGGWKGSQGPSTLYRTSIDDHVRRIGSTRSQLNCGLPQAWSSSHNHISELIAR